MPNDSSGQTFAPDFVGSIVVFGIILAVFLSSWNTVLDHYTGSGNAGPMRKQAQHTTSFLVATGGFPEDWESSGDVDIVGFATEDNVLNEEKLKEFNSFSYDKQADLLQVGDFNLTIRNKSSSEVLEIDGQKMAFGRSYSGADTVVPIERNVLVNDSGNLVDSKLEYVVWRNE